MSEWLRRQTRNLLGFACAGSNPAVDDFIFLFCPQFCYPRQLLFQLELCLIVFKENKYCWYIEDFGVYRRSDG
jgi:hypothetical protein